MSHEHLRLHVLVRPVCFIEVMNAEVQLWLKHVSAVHFGVHIIPLGCSMGEKKENLLE